MLEAVLQQLLQPGHEGLVPLTPSDELLLAQSPVLVSVTLAGTKASINKTKKYRLLLFDKEFSE